MPVFYDPRDGDQGVGTLDAEPSLEVPVSRTNVRTVQGTLLTRCLTAARARKGARRARATPATQHFLSSDRIAP